MELQEGLGRRGGRTKKLREIYRNCQRSIESRRANERERLSIKRVEFPRVAVGRISYITRDSCSYSLKMPYSTSVKYHERARMLDFVTDDETEGEGRRAEDETRCFSFLLLNLLYLPNLQRCRLQKTNGRPARFQCYRQKANRASFGRTKARYWLEERARMVCVCGRIARERV